MRIESSVDLGAIIKKNRVLQKLTQSDLAAASGTGVRYIVDLEKGKPTCALNKALHVTRMLGIKLIAEAPDDTE